MEFAILIADLKESSSDLKKQLELIYRQREMLLNCYIACIDGQSELWKKIESSTIYDNTQIDESNKNLIIEAYIDAFLPEIEYEYVILHPDNDGQHIVMTSTDLPNIIFVPNSILVFFINRFIYFIPIVVASTLTLAKIIGNVLCFMLNSHSMIVVDSSLEFEISATKEDLYKDSRTKLLFFVSEIIRLTGRQILNSWSINTIEDSEQKIISAFDEFKEEDIG